VQLWLGRQHPLVLDFELECVVKNILHVSVLFGLGIVGEDLVASLVVFASRPKKIPSIHAMGIPHFALVRFFM
jgi:hypothetical protein